jgi:hypothetical protein
MRSMPGMSCAKPAGPPAPRGRPAAARNRAARDPGTLPRPEGGRTATTFEHRRRGAGRACRLAAGPHDLAGADRQGGGCLLAFSSSTGGKPVLIEEKGAATAAGLDFTLTGKARPDRPAGRWPATSHRLQDRRPPTRKEQKHFDKQLLLLARWPNGAFRTLGLGSGADRLCRAEGRAQGRRDCIAGRTDQRGLGGLRKADRCLCPPLAGLYRPPGDEGRA